MTNAIEHRTGSSVTPEEEQQALQPLYDTPPLLAVLNEIGLGLYVARQLIEAMHGRIDVHSTKQDGTTFEITLPRHWAETSAAA